MIAEYWADGPHSELPPGHWNLFAQFVAQRDRHGDSNFSAAGAEILRLFTGRDVFGASVTFPRPAARASNRAGCPRPI